ncbi:hypothetical protein [Haloarchaeobius sp. DYHT-AS-18]|uniref:hypothetical protein n=1 Tax=Haloarchaeobius sp. DYHT-AS-18 TaxID=3446117 RepID=UPI003EBB4022
MSSHPFSAAPELHDLTGPSLSSTPTVELTCTCGESYQDPSRALDCYATHE